MVEEEKRKKRKKRCAEKAELGEEGVVRLRRKKVCLHLSVDFHKCVDRRVQKRQGCSEDE